MQVFSMVLLCATHMTTVYIKGARWSETKQFNYFIYFPKLLLTFFPSAVVL